MKSLAFIPLCLAMLLAGCESMSTRVQERFSAVAPQTHIYAADQRVVYHAAQQALKVVGLLPGRASIARGSIDGYAPIRSGDATQNARQTTIEVRLFETEALETRVEVLVWEHQEGSFPGGVSEQALRQHSLYDGYFTALQHVLETEGAIKVAVKH